MTLQVTQTQKNILQHLQSLQKNIPYKSIPQIYLTSSSSDIGKKLNKSNFLSQPAFWLQPSPQSIPKQHIQLQTKLKQYKSKSTFIQIVGNLIHQYDVNFKHLQKQRIELIQTIKKIHKDTSQLMQKQKKYIDLANSVKQTLDYYILLDKFQFNYACEINGRQMFEDQLQPTISELTDAIQFFTTNSNYANAKKYLNGLISSKTRVVSFTKSFLIKLLNKQYGFSIKNSKSQLLSQIDGFYPKSKPKFLVEFLSCFPQFLKLIKIILLTTKQSSNEQQVSGLIKRQTQIDQFVLNDRIISLLSYLQKNIPQVYEQVILKFISYYRITFHQNFHKNFQPSPSSESSAPPQQKFQQYFHDIFVQSIYILTCEACYIWYWLKPWTDIAKEYARNTFFKIVQLYSNELVKIAKSPGKNKDPFSICNQVEYIMMEYHKFIRNYTSRQYQTYVLGVTIEYIQQFGIEMLTSIFEKIAQRIKAQLEQACQNKLPKFKQTNSRTKLMQDIKQLIQIIPNIKYCEGYAEKYLVTSLDTIVKSIKEVNNQIESRLECYAWNIEIFAVIQDNLSRLPYVLIKKEVKLDVGETTRIIEKVRNVSRSQNLLKYASDLFTVIRTGVPTLAQLTLDFNTFIKDYFTQLKEKFVKDMVFVHAKNVIQFLQALKEVSPDQAAKMCDVSILRNLQTSFKQSIESYINQSNNIIIFRRKQFAIYEHGETNLIKLLNQVKQTLLDLMGLFYVEASKFSTETQHFQNIREIRKKLTIMTENQKVNNQ